MVRASRSVGMSSVMGMVMADATGGSEGEGWGKEIAAICGSGLQDTWFYPGSPPIG
jgi:hypothetical protein